MKSYGNYLLMENLLYNVPGTKKSIQVLAINLFSPVTTIMESDCGTTLGLEQGILQLVRGGYNFALHSNGAAITAEELTALLASGQQTIHIRHSGSCISTGGICQKCWYANVLQSTANYTDPDTAFDAVPPPSFSEVVLPEIGSKVTLRSKLGHVKEYFTSSERAIMSYVADSYTGGLVGIKSYDSFPLPLKPSLMRASINKNLLDRAMQELAEIPDVPGTFLSYLDGLDDSLEKAAGIVLVYCVYGADAANTFPETFPLAPTVKLVS